jgi:hypothetical protein
VENHHPPLACLSHCLMSLLLPSNAGSPSNLNTDIITKITLPLVHYTSQSIHPIAVFISGLLNSTHFYIK